VRLTARIDCQALVAPPRKHQRAVWGLLSEGNPPAHAAFATLLRASLTRLPAADGPSVSDSGDVDVNLGRASGDKDAAPAEDAAEDADKSDSDDNDDDDDDNDGGLLRGRTAAKGTGGVKNEAQPVKKYHWHKDPLFCDLDCRATQMVRPVPLCFPPTALAVVTPF